MATASSMNPASVETIINKPASIIENSDMKSPSLSPESTPSISALLSPSTMHANQNGFLNISAFTQKFSIHHQDAEVSIADATDCLRMVSGKIDWFHRKQAFCPHLVSSDDAMQVAALHQKILIEEVPFLELKTRLRDGLVVDIPRELEGRVQVVCGMFDELKHRINDLILHLTNVGLVQ
ncbi:hypothetical protein RDWZM_001832 [Blomia tropicalis]|uniref:Uncharacterized protein n=1 Tax=Blomia tropicalis TaxID=40697 RepID=A0A9Q0MF01_BLOTA|nr:hypothetical protein RDWZM_001832 [Blomia tropicalis]